MVLVEEAGQGAQVEAGYAKPRWSGDMLERAGRWRARRAAKNGHMRGVGARASAFSPASGTASWYGGGGGGAVKWGTPGEGGGRRTGRRWQGSDTQHRQTEGRPQTQEVEEVVDVAIIQMLGRMAAPACRRPLQEESRQHAVVHDESVPEDGSCVACATGTTSAGGNATECTARVVVMKRTDGSRATGGNITTFGDYVIHNFTSIGTSPSL